MKQTRKQSDSKRLTDKRQRREHKQERDRRRRRRDYQLLVAMMD